VPQLFSPKYRLSYPHEVDWTPFQARCFSGNLIAPKIEPGTPGSVIRNSARPQRRSIIMIIIIIIIIIMNCREKLK
jgi:hypothetical protein